jgi:hypothetical protein
MPRGVRALPWRVAAVACLVYRLRGRARAILPDVNTQLEPTNHEAATNGSGYNPYIRNGHAHVITNPPVPVK